MDFDGAGVGVEGFDAEGEGFGDGVDEDFFGDAVEVGGREGGVVALEEEDARGADVGDFVDAELADFVEYAGAGGIVLGMGGTDFDTVDGHGFFRSIQGIG